MEGRGGDSRPFSTMKEFSLALWAVNIAHYTTGPEQWLALLDRQLGHAKEKGAQALLLPEYVSAQWLHWANGPLSPIDGLQFMAEQGSRLIEEMQALANRHDMALFAGTFPVKEENIERPFNRFHAFFPEREKVTYDKLVLTPSEKNIAAWQIQTGLDLKLFSWRGVNFLPLICLDVEMPAIAAQLQDKGIDILLVPSMTERLSGYHRVFDCAKARAIELYCFVAAVGCIGNLQEQGGVGANCSGAAFFAPSDMAFGGSGILNRIGPFEGDDGPGPLLVQTLSIEKLRKWRALGGEVWPGALSFDDLSFQKIL